MAIPVAAVAAIKLRLDSVPAPLSCELAAFVLVLGVVIGHLATFEQMSKFRSA
jgi:hypothetical protein